MRIDIRGLPPLKTVILDVTEANNEIEIILKRELAANSDEFHYYKLKELNINPCRACGACSEITPGLCALKDDMQGVLRSLAQSNRIIMLTPVRFGGYSSLLKRAVDRFVVLGLPTLTVIKGKLLHPMRYDTKSLLAIGLEEEEIPGAKENFKKIVERNALNMQSPYRALVFNASIDKATVEADIVKALSEVKVI